MMQLLIAVCFFFLFFVLSLSQMRSFDMQHTTPGICEGDSCRFNLDIATQMISVTLPPLITASPSTWIVIKNAKLQAALWPELIF